ncbi:MAG: TlpA disulfide reductase family protein [Rhodoferax sp.]|uniref:TlpA family protein disulfide reductase n=1 Tax=Rhodoferax sp. TaxID=50421 RepID=UPI00261B1479|nr:TlpA disulfide reductase family protein [Rhodoferax sp.]MDD2880055.1 TlpA disulfide reductase family protein [Rhodoferax sp.]
MKKVITKIAALLLTTLLGVTAQALDLGQPAPLFSLPGVQAAVDLSSFKGQTVYLDFWASWCGPCKQSFPWMNEMQTKYSSKGLRVVAVNVDQRHADATLFLKDNPTNFTVAFDAIGQTPKNYAIRGMPTSVLIGPDGKVISIHNGFKAEHRAELETQIKQALHL